MRFVTTASFAPIFITSTIWLGLEAPTTQALVFRPDIGNLTVGPNGLFEGDIMLHGNSGNGTPGMSNSLFEARIALYTNVRLWENGTIPYVIDDELKQQKQLIRRAMDEIEKVTCLRFVPRTSQHEDYVRLVNGNGCYSSLGCEGRGPQELSLGYGCWFKTTVMHELLHAAGFVHEHSRSDRDDYIDILLENVMEGKENQFDKLAPSEDQLLSPFDYDSVMLYGSGQGSQNGLPTIVKKDGTAIPDVESKPGLSLGDVQGIRETYGCR
ncbi:astacin-like metalloprotease toxin 5 [Haemaphysalis longicornis]